MCIRASLWMLYAIESVLGVGKAYAVEVCVGEMYWLLRFNLLYIEVLIVLHIDTICCSVHGCYTGTPVISIHYASS